MPELPSEREIIELIGEQRAQILKINTPGRICGMLTARGRNWEWEKALEHIRLHFFEAPHKEAHSRFVKKLCDPDRLKDYVKRATCSPSSTVLTRQNIGGKPIGTPCLLIMRNFNEPIGLEPGQSWLVVIADFQGKLVTAYPDSEATLRRKEQLG
jgi:hypothetical protein